MSDDDTVAVDQAVDVSALDRQQVDVMDAGMAEDYRLQYPSITPSHGVGQLIPIRTTEQARAIAEKRWGRYRRAAETGMALGVVGPKDNYARAEKVQAYTELVAVQARIAIDEHDKRSPFAFRNVRAAIGADVGAPARAVDVSVSASQAGREVDTIWQAMKQVDPGRAEEMLRQAREILARKVDQVQADGDDD